MLKAVVGHAHAEGVLLLAQDVVVDYFLLLDEVYQLAAVDYCVGRVAARELFELAREPVWGAQGLAVDVAVFSVAEAKLDVGYSFPLGRRSSSFAVRVGRMIWYTLTLGFLASSLISVPSFFSTIYSYSSDSQEPSSSSSS